MAMEAKMTREEQARREVGLTEIDRATAFVLTLAFCALIASVPLVQFGLDNYAGDRESDPGFTAAIPSSGEIAAFERSLEDRSFLRRLLIGPISALLAHTLAVGNERVHIGRDGWLFYREDLDFLLAHPFLDPAEQRRRTRSDDHPSQTDPLRALVHFRDQLAERNIALLVMPVPVKPTIHPEAVDASAHAPLENAAYGDCLAALRAAGIEVFDPTAALLEEKKTNGSAYLRDDTHWTPGAMRRVAADLARKVNELLPIDSDAGYRFEDLSLTNRGDIAAMLALPHGGELAPEQAVTIRRVLGTDDGEFAADPASPILFLGDSFANIYSRAELGWGSSAGLVEQLAAELGTPLDRITINNGGAHATRLELARQMATHNDRLLSTRLVILEFVAREFSKGDWRLIDLPRAVTMESPGTTVPRPMTIRGRIAAVTPAPTPGGPYGDALIALHVTAVESADGGRQGDLVVFTWGLRAHRLQAGSRLKPGDLLRAHLIPWREAEARYGSYNRVEFDDPALLALPFYWHDVVEEEESPAEPARTGPIVLPEHSAATLPELLKTAEAQGTMVVPGGDGFLFYTPEIRSLLAAPFWGANATAVSRAANPQFADPLPAIRDFHRQLAERGIDLLIVPVPAKASVYADLLPPAADAGAAQRRFHEILRAEGLRVIDLEEVFIAARRAGSPPLYCRTDTHWSPVGIALAASAIRAAIGEPDWWRTSAQGAAKHLPVTVEFFGDLTRMSGNPIPRPETLPGERIEFTAGGSTGAVRRESPILLLGDSHTLVFHLGGDLYAEGCGLPDHLAAAFGVPIDLVAVRGSGATAARISLARRPDSLTGTKLVIWCFAARDYTEATGGWRPIPLPTPKP